MDINIIAWVLIGVFLTLGITSRLRTRQIQMEVLRRTIFIEWLHRGSADALRVHNISTPWTARTTSRLLRHLEKQHHLRRRGDSFWLTPLGVQTTIREWADMPEKRAEDTFFGKVLQGEWEQVMVETRKTNTVSPEGTNPYVREDWTKAELGLVS